MSAVVCMQCGRAYAEREDMEGTSHGVCPPCVPKYREWYRGFFGAEVPWLVKQQLEKESVMSKPVCRLSGEDGNVFSIIGRVKRSLKDAGMSARAEQFATEAMTARSYDAVLQLCFKYVDVR
jgi:hypothetical protein